MLEQRLQELEAISARMTADTGTRSTQQQRLQAHIDQFISRRDQRPAYGAAPQRDSALSALAIDREPRTLEEALETIDAQVQNAGHNLDASGFFGYIPSGALFEAAQADYLAAVINRYAGVAYAAPGVTRMDQVLLRWLADQLGYPATADGDLCSGASIATLSAVVAAREWFRQQKGDPQHGVIYLTAQTHHTFAKALHIAGLSNSPLRTVPTDDAHRLRVPALKEQLAADRAAGLTPWLLVATAGATNTGAIDPLPALADLAQTEGLWLHVDAAYGGAFALCGPGRARLRGIERSDSLVIDPHKGLFLPCGLGVLLVRQGRVLLDAYRARGDYMQDMDEETRSPCDLSPELTRPFRALRLWLPLRVHGVDAFAAALEEKLLLAKYCYDKLKALPGLQLGPTPDLSIVPFRYAPPGADAEVLNQALLAHLNADGRVHLSSTRLGGEFWLRIAILNVRSHRADVDAALDRLRQFIDAY